MEDKYFNEFFDKLYNGKLNIYEDEEEETSDEDVVDLDVDDEEVNDDNEQNSISPKNTNYSLDELKKIIGKKSSENLIFDIKFLLNEIGNYKSLSDEPVGKSFKEKQLNGFWELYDISSNGSVQPSWREYIRENNPKYIEGFKEYLKKFIENKLENKYPEFEKKLNELYYQQFFLNKTFSKDIDLIKKNYNDLKEVEKRRPLNGFWELYDKLDEKKTKSKGNRPSWRKYIRHGDDYIEGLKEYMKSYINKKCPEFEKKLNELYYQQFFLNKTFSKDIDLIIKKNYNELPDEFKSRPLNGFWELYDKLDEKKTKSIIPSWRKYIRHGDDYIEGLKEYMKSYINTTYSNFEDRLNILFKQKGEGYENTFTKKYGGENYFKKINVSNESRIHDLNSEKISIKDRINSYVNDEINNDLEYLTTELTNDDINYIKDNLVDPVYENIINYLGNDENKVVSYDLECLQPLINNGKTVIGKGDLIEVKDNSKLDSYYSEYIASPVKKSGSIKTPKGKEIYKVFVYNLLEKIKNKSSETFDKIINDVYGKISGMIIADNIYVPKENIILYISSQGQGYGRITLRYNINPKGDFYKIIKPKDYEDDDNVSESLKIRKLRPKEISKLKSMGKVKEIYPKDGVNESYDSYLDQLVENFFNTGKLFP